MLPFSAAAEKVGIFKGYDSVCGLDKSILPSLVRSVLRLGLNNDIVMVLGCKGGTMVQGRKKRRAQHGSS